MKTILTPEESQRLIELGVDPKLASESVGSMAIGNGVRGITKLPSPQPIFNLADILSTLPKEIEYNNERISLQMYQHLAGYWITSYVKYNGNELIIQNPVCTENELIDALNKLLVRCLEQKIIKLNND